MIKGLIIGFLSGILALSAISIFTISSSCETDIVKNLVTIEGNVKILEPETGKVFTKVRQNLIFQRVDCKKCLSIAFTDEDGNYKLLVGKGKYRLIVREDLLGGGSSLDPNQLEIIDAKNKVTRNTFDIKLIRHKNPLDITLPLQE